MQVPVTRKRKTIVVSDSSDSSDSSDDEAPAPVAKKQKVVEAYRVWATFCVSLLCGCCAPKIKSFLVWMTDSGCDAVGCLLYCLYTRKGKKSKSSSADSGVVSLLVKAYPEACFIRSGNEGLMPLHEAVKNNTPLEDIKTIIVTATPPVSVIPVGVIVIVQVPQ